jgi:hypothetical protein
MARTLSCRLQELLEKTDRQEDIIAEVQRDGDYIDVDVLRFILSSEIDTARRLFSILDAVED